MGGTVAAPTSTRRQLAKERALIHLAAAVEMRPEHTVHIEGDWLVLRLPEETR